MFCLECDHIPEKYPEILRLTIEHGRLVEPRGYECLEISPLVITASSPRKRLFGTPARNENPIFSYVEGLWILKGEDTPDMLSHYVKQTRCYVSPRTGKFDGAYGPRLRNVWGMDQLDTVHRKLLNDRDTRRAVITIFDPRKDNNDDSLDIPCTISWQFMIRDKKLDMITYMRSNDLFRGFVYDTAEFQWFQEILAGWLGVEVGKYVHIVGSAHVYLNDMPRINEVLSKCENSDKPFSLYRSRAPQDARLSREDFQTELTKLVQIEEMSRKAVSIDEVVVRQIVDSILCGFYRNLALAIVAYNARKLGNEDLASKLLDSVDNEFSFLMQHENHLAPPAGSRVTIPPLVFKSGV